MQGYFISSFVSVPLCRDPGRVADAEHVILDSLGNVAPDQSYQLTYQVEYNCTRPGYGPNVTEPLQCVYVDPSDVDMGTRWEGVRPTCVGKCRTIYSLPLTFVSPVLHI